MRKHITAFYLETLILIAVFAAVILVLTSIFCGARAQSARADHLTGAVMLAENAAEAVAASESIEALLEFLEKEGDVQRAGSVLTLTKDGYHVNVTWEREGALAASTITVSWNQNEIYTLETAVAIREGAGK